MVDGIGDVVAGEVGGEGRFWDRFQLVPERRGEMVLTLSTTSLCFSPSNPNIESMIQLCG